MAFGWRPPRRTGGAAGRGGAGPADGGSLLVLARADHEAASGLADAPFEVATPLPVTRADWRSTGLAAAAWKAVRYVPKFAHRWPAFRGLWFQPALRAGFAAINRINIAEGVRLFSGRRAAVVDRLHAHVLSVLLDLDHVLVDNSYGKLGAVYRDYSGGFSRARYVTSAAEALAFVGELEAGHPHPELAPAGSREA
jgi:pyruvyl transferase EpsO